MAGHDQYSGGRVFGGLLVPAAANKGAMTRPTGGLIEPLAWAGSSIDRQTDRGIQTKMVTVTSTF